MEEIVLKCSIFLKNVLNMPLGFSLARSGVILNILSESTRTVMIENGLVLITGDKLIGSFDQLEVAEFSAKSLIMSNSLGSLNQINDEQVEELRKVFLLK